VFPFTKLAVAASIEAAMRTPKASPVGLNGSLDSQVDPDGSLTAERHPCQTTTGLATIAQQTDTIDRLSLPRIRLRVVPDFSIIGHLE
jgi:hypothetical protein